MKSNATNCKIDDRLVNKKMKKALQVLESLKKLHLYVSMCRISKKVMTMDVSSLSGCRVKVSWTETKVSREKC